MSKLLIVISMLSFLSSCKVIRVIHDPKEPDKVSYQICTNTLSPEVAIGVSQARKSTDSNNQYFGECIVATCQNGFIKVDSSPLNEGIFHARHEEIGIASMMPPFEIPPFFCAQQSHSCDYEGVSEGEREWIGIDWIFNMGLRAESASIDEVEPNLPFWQQIGSSPCFNVTCQEGYTAVAITAFPFNPNER